MSQLQFYFTVHVSLYGVQIRYFTVHVSLYGVQIRYFTVHVPLYGVQIRYFKVKYFRQSQEKTWWFSGTFQGQNVNYLSCGEPGYELIGLKIQHEKHM